ncbi:putative conidiation protein 6 [Lyophyllum shimeji]|uniref:Conidiation protein 6 n=1 Tax=Lyophyllum shimeji TaxID=47721 RepID=A0A9P3UHW4_LYOSH|nr:putative conidiation protein 6 [Lyophyllum shimeji]
MPLFGRGRPSHTATSPPPGTRRSLLHRRNKKPGGLRAALSSQNSNRSGRKHAKERPTRGRGREARVPFMTRVKRALGIYSTNRHATTMRRRHLF